MTVWQKIYRFATVGVAVGALTACSNLVGYQPATLGGDVHFTTGFAEYQQINGGGVAFLIGGNWVSRTGLVHSASGTVKDVQARTIVASTGPGDCDWSPSLCTGVVAVSDRPGRLYATTGDTNGDGYISGAADFQPAGAGQNCGMTKAATATTAQPASAWWQDRVNCAFNDPNFASAESNASPDGRWFSSAAGAHHGPNSLFQNLPFETIQGIMNSMESSDVRTEYMNDRPVQVAKVQVTNVSVGGESYKPVNVFVELYDWRFSKWDMSKQPGLKLMAAWMANKMETLLDRNATSIRLTLELNGSVTLTRADLSQNHVFTEPSYSGVEYLRNFATTNIRD